MKRKIRIVLGVLLVLIAIPAVMVARAAWFPPRFDVVSITTTPEYQRTDLLDRAWALPVAQTFAKHLDWQSNGSLCGPASVANAWRSLGNADATEAVVLDDTGLCRTGMCFMGLTLDELTDVARTKTARKVTLLRDLTPESFREHLAHMNDPGRRYLVNFHRGLLFGKGGGHHSPIGGYLPAENLVFVLDVNEKFKPWLVASERLFTAMDSVDSSSGRKRGLLLIE